MSHHHNHDRHDAEARPDEQSRYSSYVIGFFLSVITTLAAYFLVVFDVLPQSALVYVILGIAVVQLVVQMVFFLHIGRGMKWSVMTFAFTAIIVLILVVGSIWVMDNLNYNMMEMSPDQMELYMSENQGL